MTDREKLAEWLAACPVTLRKVDDFAHGYVEVHVNLDDERDETDEDWRFPWGIGAAEDESDD